MKAPWLLCGPVMLLATAQAPLDQMQPLSMDVRDLRSNRGNLLVCVTRMPQHFPDCRGDPDRRHFTVPVAAAPIFLGMLPPGHYAIALIHDENGNGKLDTFAKIPREGVGFSRNPAIRFGAPSFRAAEFKIAGSAVRQDIKVRYFL